MGRKTQPTNQLNLKKNLNHGEKIPKDNYKQVVNLNKKSVCTLSSQLTVLYTNSFSFLFYYQNFTDIDSNTYSRIRGSGSSPVS